MPRMWRWVVGLLVLAVGFAVGNPYFSWAIARVMGEQTAFLVHQDGTKSTLVSGPGVAPPDWVPVMPGALVVKGSRWPEFEGRPSRSGRLEILSHDEVGPIVAWYAAQLAERGFDVAPAKPPDAFDGYMGIDGQVMASSASRGVDVRVVVRPRQGIVLKPRLVEIDWFDRGAKAGSPAPR